MKNAFFYVAGIAFLILAKLKHAVSGYATPKPFALNEVDRCIDYDASIANRMVANIASYDGLTIQGKRLLELGPGSDLGVGLLLVSKGASAYVGFDRHNLAENVPATFYERLANRFGVDPTALIDGRVTYVAREDFKVAAGVRSGVDIVVSNAAFEHFDDVAATVAQLSAIARPGTKAVIEVDLQTHSRWIRDVDPNNIYRYPEWFYRLWSYPGQPNRVRPDDYRRIFDRHGWADIRMSPANRLNEGLTDCTVHKAFRGRQLDWLSFILFATKQG